MKTEMFAKPSLHYCKNFGNMVESTHHREILLFSDRFFCHKQAGGAAQTGEKDLLCSFASHLWREGSCAQRRIRICEEPGRR